MIYVSNIINFMGPKKMIDFKIVKDKNIRKLYKNIYNHLDYIFSNDDLDLLNNYLKDIKSYLNGYTSNNKMFQQLRKINLIYKSINVNYLVDFTSYKIHYLKYPNIKRFSDLIVYANNQSRLAFFLLIINDINTVNIAANLSVIDIFSYILTNYNYLLINNKIHFASQDVFDFNLTVKNNYYKVDEALLAIFNRLSFKIKESYDNYKKAITFLDDCQKSFIDSIINNQLSNLDNLTKSTFSELT